MKKASGISFLWLTTIIVAVGLLSCEKNSSTRDADGQQSDATEEPLAEDDPCLGNDLEVDGIIDDDSVDSSIQDDDMYIGYGNCYNPNDSTNQELLQENILYDYAVRTYFAKNTDATSLRMTAEKVRTFNYENDSFAGYELRCKIVEEDLSKIDATSGSTVSVSMLFVKELHAGLVPPQDNQTIGRIFTVEMHPLFWGSRTGELCEELIAVIRTEKGELVSAMVFISENPTRPELDIWPSTILSEFDAWLATPVNCPQNENGRSQPPLVVENKVRAEQIEVLSRHVGTMNDYAVYVWAASISVKGKESDCFTTSGFVFSIYSKKFMEGQL